MRSKAHLKSHPLHPILIPFPLAFFSGTLVFHLLASWRDHDGLHHTAYYMNLAGIIMAIVAAVPGIIDFLGVVPPKSSAKKRAAQHGLLNVTSLILFTIAWFHRRGIDPNESLVFGLEVLGVGLMMVAGSMGGTLVYRNQIGVDVRYANAGKWNEAYFDTETGTIEVADAGELKVNAMKLLHVKDRRIVLARTETSYVAFDDRCTHKGGSLAGGSLMCGTVQCPWHGSQFDVRTGTVSSGPAKESIRTYAVAEREGKVFLTL